MNDLKPRERMRLPRQPMPEQEPARRRSNFEEVNLGFEPPTAVEEARRCLQCPDPRCVGGSTLR